MVPTDWQIVEAVEAIDAEQRKIGLDGIPYLPGDHEGERWAEVARRLAVTEDRVRDVMLARWMGLC